MSDGAGFVGTKVGLLLVEADDAEATRTAELLAEAHRFRCGIDRVASVQAARREMERRAHDVCLACCRLADGDVFDILRSAAAIEWASPVIVLIDRDSLGIEAAAARAGAVDFLVKGRFDAEALSRAVRYALETARAARTLRADRHELVGQAEALQRARHAIEDQRAYLADFATELEAVHRKAEEAGASRATLLATMSRELSGLTADLLEAAGGLQQTALDDRQRRSVASIEDAGRAVLRMLSCVEGYARLEAGRPDPGAVAFGFEALVRAVAEAAEERARGLGIRLATRIDSRLAAPLVGDPQRIEQVLASLLERALAAGRAGTVQLTAEPLHEEPDATVVRVRIAEIGRAGPREPAGRPPADGLVLAICRAVTREMGGEIEVAGAGGSGAEVRLDLRLGCAGRPAQSHDGAPGRAAIRALPERGSR